MACGATLKRHHEFDPHLGIPNGCSPKRIKISYEDIMATDTYQPSQNFVEATQRLAHDQLVPRALPSSSHSIFQTYSSTHSPITWKNIVSPSSSPKSTQTQSKITQPKNEPMVSTSIASYVCNQLVEEHEKKLREHYERVLIRKLAEKYESYIKFNHDLLKDRFGQSSASYVS